MATEKLTEERIESVEHRKIPLYLYIKRFNDLVIAFLLLPVALVLIGLFAILIKLETPGPVFYIQERSGLNGKRFLLYKLRSMGVDAEKNGATWAVVNDPRITKIGKFIRKTRIDELPQLLNVLRGDMSMIGPRPERPIFIETFNKTMPKFKERLTVKPGLTGWAQVNGGYDLLPEEKLLLDLYYIEKIGMKLDLYIMIRTLKVIVSGDGAR